MTDRTIRPTPGPFASSRCSVAWSAERRTLCEPRRMFLWWAFFGCAAGVIGCGYGVFSLMLLEGSYQPLGILEAASFRTAEEAHAASLAARDPDPVDVYEVLMLGIPLLAVAAAVVFLALLHLDAGRRRRKRERHEPTRVLGAAVASMS